LLWRCHSPKLVHQQEITTIMDVIRRGGTMMEIVSSILSAMPGVGKVQRRFLVVLFTAILVSRGKVNFRNLSRYSDLNEKTYSRQFAKSFDFVQFNRQLIGQAFGKSSERISVFDASFIKKAGPKTYGNGFFYNGCHHRAEKGLEISSLAIVDIPYHTALTLSVKQSPPLAQKARALDSETLMDHYINHIKEVRPYLYQTETILVLDGNFARIKVFEALNELALTSITRLRCDADMRYFYEGPKRPSGSGRQKLYDGKVHWQDLSRFDDLGDYEGYKLYTKVLNHRHFKRTLRVVVILDPLKEGPDNYVLLATTDVHLDARTIVRYYRARFQIEFTYRDGKQYTGLADCQARDKNRLDFHFNASLTTLNIARTQQIKAKDTAKPFVFSMASIKTRYFNEHYINLLFSILGIQPELIKKSPHYQTLCNYGAIAA
jgi:hypothetical protein